MVWKKSERYNMGKRILTDKERTEIKLLFQAGKSKSLLATRYGVERGTIRYIVDPEYAAEQREKMRIYQANKKVNGEKSNG